MTECNVHGKSVGGVVVYDCKFSYLIEDQVKYVFLVSFYSFIEFLLQNKAMSFINTCKFIIHHKQTQNMFYVSVAWLFMH